MDAYDGWAEQYEADLLNLQYTAPKVAMTLVLRHISPGHASILDAGAGTGIMGALLYRHGFTRLTAVDFSEHMLQVARKKDVYREIRKMVLGEVLDFPDHHFDHVVCIGVFAGQNAPPETMEELHRVLAPGGFFFFSVREDVFESRGFCQTLEQMEAEGKWRRMEVTDSFPGLLGQAQNTPTRLFVYRKTPPLAGNRPPRKC